MSFSKSSLGTQECTRCPAKNKGERANDTEPSLGGSLGLASCEDPFFSELEAAHKQSGLLRGRSLRQRSWVHLSDHSDSMDTDTPH